MIKDISPNAPLKNCYCPLNRVFGFERQPLIDFSFPDHFCIVGREVN